MWALISKGRGDGREEGAMGVKDSAKGKTAREQDNSLSFHTCTGIPRGVQHQALVHSEQTAGLRESCGSGSRIHITVDRQAARLRWGQGPQHGARARTRSTSWLVSTEWDINPHTRGEISGKGTQG